MSKNTRYFMILVLVGFVTLLAGLWAEITFHPPPMPPNLREDLEFYYIVKTVVSTLNVALLAVLLVMYIDIYRKTRSEFTIGLIIFSLVFLLQNLAGNPIVVMAFGFRTVGLGPFIMLPDLFTLAALIVLMYLSVKY